MERQGMRSSDLLTSQSQWNSAGRVILGSALISFVPFLVEFSDLSAFANGFYRMAIGGLVLLLIALFRKENWPNLRMTGLCFLAAVTIALDTVVWNQSVLYIGSGLATVLANLEVVFMVLIGTLFFAEKLQPLFFAICAVIMLGVYLLISPYFSEMHTYRGVGIALAIGASFVYSIYFFLLKLVANQNQEGKVSTISILAMICLFAALILALLIVCVPSATFAIPNSKSLYCVLLNGLLGQVVGWLLITNGLKNLSFSLSGLIMLTQPALTFLFDCLFLKRNTELLQIIGCVVLLAAVYSTTYLDKKRVKENEPS